MNKLATRNIFLSACVLVLVAVVLIFRTGKPFGKNQTAFAVNSGEITRIEISDGTGAVKISKEGNRWLVDGKYEARRSIVSLVSENLREMKIKSPVSPDLFGKEITSRGIKPVKVSIYDGVRLINRFLVYRTSSNRYGNIMKKSPGAKPFIVCVPGFEGDIGSDFNPDELFWRPFTIFNVLPSEISEITLENRAEPSSSFKISFSGTTCALSDLGKSLAGWDTARVRRYASYFVNIPFEKWATDISQPEKEAIERSEPHYVIDLRKTDGTEVKLTLWDRQNTGGTSSDSDRLWGKTGAVDRLFIVRYFDIDPVIRKLSYFYGQ